MRTLRRVLGALGAVLALAASHADARVVMLNTPPPAQPQPQPGALPRGEAPTGPDADEARRLNAQGLALVQAKQYDAAEKVLTQTLAICDSALHGEHYCVAGATLNLALVAEGRGDLLSAEKFITRAGMVTFAAMGPKDLQFGYISIKLGRILVMEGKFRQAEPVLRTGIEILEHAGDGRSTMTGVLDLAQVFRATQRLPQAEDLLRQLFPVCPHADPTCEATTRARLGETLWSLDRPGEAEAELRKSAALYAAIGRTDGQEGALATLANAFLGAAKFTEAEPLLKAQLEAELARKTDPPGSIAVLEADLAKVYVSTDRRELGEPLIKSAEARLAAEPMTPNMQGVVADKAGGVELELNHLDLGRTLLERALATPTPNQAIPPWWKADAEGALGDVAELQQRLSDAEARFRKSADDYAAASNVQMNRFRRNQLGQVLIFEHRRDEAEGVLKALLTEVSAAQPAAPKWVAAVEANLAALANDRRDFKTAQTLVTDALAKQVGPGQAPDREATGMLDALGEAELGLGLYKDAEGHLSAAAKLMAASRVPHVDALAGTRSRLCEVYSAQGRLDDTMACAKDLAALIAGWPQATATWRMNALLTEGNALYEAGLYEPSRDRFLAATKIETEEVAVAATANMNLGQAYMAMGEYDKALTAMTRSRGLFAQVGPESQDGAVESGRRLADLYMELGRYQEAEPLVRASLAWFESNLGASHPRTALQVRALGRLMMDAGRAQEAEPLFRRALEIRRGAPAPNPTLIAQSFADVARADQALRRYDQARDYFRQAEAAEAEAKGKTHWYVGSAVHELGELDALQGHYADAEANYRRAEPLLAGGGEAAQSEAMALKTDLARLDTARGRYRAAEPVFRANLAWSESRFGPNHPRTAAEARTLAWLLLDAGRPAEAQALFQRVLNIRRAAPAINPVLLAESLVDMARCDAALSLYAPAREALRQAEAADAQALGVAHWRLGLVALELGALEAAQSRFAEAEGEYRRAEPLLAAGGELTHEDVLSLKVDRARLAVFQDRFDDARALLKDVLAEREKTWGAESVYIVDELGMISGLDEGAGRYPAAQAGLTRILGIERKAHGEGAPRMAYWWTRLASVFQRAGRGDEAEQAVITALSIQRGGEGMDAPSALQVLMTAADIHANRGKLEDARREADAALALARALKTDSAATWPLEAVGDVARRQKRFADGEVALTEAVDKARALWGGGVVGTAAAMADLASLEIAAGRPEKAQALFEQAGEALRKTLPANHLANIYLTNDLGLSYLAQGQAARAEALVKPLLDRLAGRGGEADIATAYVQFTLSQAYLAQGRPAEAAAAAALAKALLGDNPPPPPREQRL